MDLRGKKLILLEVNEVPHKIFDYWRKNKPDSVLSSILSRSRRLTTISSDKGELHPWSTWPTLARGVDNTEHHIKDLSQDLTKINETYPPIWDFTSKANISTGVFSSLHTYPLPEDVNTYQFYVPDPFALGSDTYPTSLTSFQNFNLRMTHRSGRNVDSGIDLKAAMALVWSLPFNGLRLSTALKTANQLINERSKPWMTSRRRSFQAILAFDLFFKQFKNTKPEFVTFFTNHVASAMHRYWAATFPEDYDKHDLPKEWVKRYKDEIPFCMKELDAMITSLNSFLLKNPDYTLIIASSMGQSATKAELVESELFLTDFDNFSKHFDDHKLEPLSAMHPQYNFKSYENTDSLEQKLSNHTINGKPLRFRRKEDTFSLDLGYPNIKNPVLHDGDHQIDLSEVGFEVKPIDDQSAGTAYHIPEGSLYIYDPKTPVLNSENQDIDLREVAPAILNYFNIKKPDYMLTPGFSI